jgi:hypothetical protein
VPVELRAGVGVQLLDRGGRAEAATVGPVAGHRVERVGGQDDPGLERDRVPGDPVWVTAPVHALVVMADHIRLGIHAEAAQQAFARCGVALDQPIFRRRQRSRLSKDFPRDLELAHVVHERRAREHDQPLGRQAQSASGRHGEHGDAVAVGVGDRVVSGQSRGQDGDRSSGMRIGPEGCGTHGGPDP